MLTAPCAHGLRDVREHGALAEIQANQKAGAAVIAARTFIVVTIDGWHYRLFEDLEGCIRAELVTHDGKLRSFRGGAFITLRRDAHGVWRQLCEGHWSIGREIESARIQAGLEAGYRELIESAVP